MTSQSLYDACSGVEINRAKFDTHTSSTFEKVETETHTHTHTHTHADRQTDRIVLNSIYVKKAFTTPTLLLLCRNLSK